MMPRKRVDDENQKFSEKVAFVLIDLTKFAAQMDFGQLPGAREKWCYAIKNMWRMSDSDIPAADTTFRELYDECKLSKLSDMEKEEYEKSILEYDDVKDAIEYNRRLAREEGREEGETNTRRLLAQNMLAEGIAPDTIARISGLTEEEVLALAQE